MTRTYPPDLHAAVDASFAIGMHQHREEILWLAAEVKALAPTRVLEIGTLHGGTAVLWKALGPADAPPFIPTVTTVDLPSGRFGGHDHRYGMDDLKLKDRTAFLANRGVESIIGDSHNWETLMDVVKDYGPHYDFLFIDGDHTLPGVAADYEMYRPFVRKGGLIAFHDINDTPFHHAAGCYVDVLWRNLVETQPQACREFSLGREWGGVGLLEVK